MIRRDYILRMIEEFIQALSRIRELKGERRVQESAALLDEEFKRLVGCAPEVVSRLSETELLAKLIHGEPTQVVHTKTLLLTTLLKEAGDIAAAQQRMETSRDCYLKGLHLLLDTLARGEPSEGAEFVPKVEAFAAALRVFPLPVRTRAGLMEHYERTGQYARAEDELFAMLEAEPDQADLVEFGSAFYERLKAQSDGALIDGNLPRRELEAGQAELRARTASKTGRPPIP